MGSQLLVGMLLPDLGGSGDGEWKVSAYAPDASAPATWRRAQDNSGRATDIAASPSRFPMEEGCLSHGSILQRGQGVRTEPRGCCRNIHSFSLCPYTLYTDLFYFLKAVLRVLSLVVLGAWISDRLFSPTPPTPRRLSEMPSRTHAVPFHTSRSS